MSALGNRFLSSIALLKQELWKKDIWADFNFNTLLPLCVVVGEQRFDIFVIVLRSVVGEC